MKILTNLLNKIPKKFLIVGIMHTIFGYFLVKL